MDALQVQVAKIIRHAMRSKQCELMTEIPIESPKLFAFLPAITRNLEEILPGLRLELLEETTPFLLSWAFPRYSIHIVAIWDEPLLSVKEH